MVVRKVAVNKVAARWREFGAAAFVALTFILMGAPPLPMVAGVALAGAWNLYSYRREQAASPRKHPMESPPG